MERVDLIVASLAQLLLPDPVLTHEAADFASPVDTASERAAQSLSQEMEVEAEAEAEIEVGIAAESGCCMHMLAVVEGSIVMDLQCQYCTAADFVGIGIVQAAAAAVDVMGSVDTVFVGHSLVHVVEVVAGHTGCMLAGEAAVDHN